MEQNTMQRLKVTCNKCGAVLYGSSEDELASKFIDHEKQVHQRDVPMSEAREKVRSENAGMVSNQPLS